MEVFDDVRPKVCVRQMVCDFECFDCVCINDVCFQYCQLMFRCLNYTIKNEYLVTSNSTPQLILFVRFCHSIQYTHVVTFHLLYTFSYLFFPKVDFCAQFFFSICDIQSYTLNLLNGENVDIEHKFYKFYKFSPTQ